MVPRQTPLWITVFGKERLTNVLNTPRRRVNMNSLTWWYVLKTSWRYLCKTSWRRLEDVLKTFLQDILKTSWKRLENVLNTSWECMVKTNILVLTKTSWRRLEDVFWRPKAKLSIFGLIKTSSEDEDERRLQDDFKTSSSRRIFPGASPAQ